MKSGFTLAEVLFGLILIGAVSVLAISSFLSGYTAQKQENYIKKYCQILGEAIYAASSENRTSMNSQTLESIVPYLKGRNNGTNIRMSDGSTITQTGNTFTVAFPQGSPQTYNVSETGIDCSKWVD